MTTNRLFPQPSRQLRPSVINSLCAGLMTGLVVIFLSIPSAHGLTDTWTGAADGTTWATGGNWTNSSGLNVIPGSGDTALFNTGSNLNVNLGLASPTTASGTCGNITFDTNAGSYTLGGYGTLNTEQTLTMGSGATIQMLSTIVGTNLTETINDAVTVGTTGSLNLTNNASSSTDVLQIIPPDSGGGSDGVAASTLTLSGANTGNNIFSGMIKNNTSTGVTINKSGAGTWIFEGYAYEGGGGGVNGGSSGGVTISGGTLVAGNNAGLNDFFVTVSSVNGLGFLGGIGTVQIGDLSGASNFTLADQNSNAVTLQINNISLMGIATYSGVISGAGGILEVGNSTETFSGVNTYTGTTVLSGPGGALSVQYLRNGGIGSGIGASTNAASNLVLAGGILQYTGTGNVSTDRLFTLGAGGGTIDSEATTAAGLTFSNSGAIAFSGTQQDTLTLTGATIASNTLSASIGNNGAAATTLVKNGVTSWAITTATNTYSGGTVINGGSLTFSGTAGAGTGTVTINGGGTLIAGTGNVQSWLSQIATASTGDIALNGGTDSENLTFGANTATLMLGATTGTSTFTGTITPAGSTYYLGGGGGTLVISTNATLSGANNLVVGAANYTGVGTTQALSTGVVVLSASNAMTGATTVNAGTLNLSTVNGQLSNSAVTVNSGATLAIDNSAGVTGATSTVRASSLTLNNAAVTVTGTTAANTTDIITGNLTLGSGYSTVTAKSNASKTVTLSAAGISRAAGAGTALINGVGLGENATASNATYVLLTNAPTLVGTTAANATGDNSSAQNTVIDPYLVGEATTTTGGVGTATGTADTFLTYNATTGLRPLNLTDEFTKNSFVAGNNTYITLGETVASSLAINSLVISGGNVTITDGDTLTDTSGALLITTANNILPSSATGTLAFGSAEALITVNSGISSTISAPITGSGGITKSGLGTLTLSGSNTFSGLVSVQAGTLSITNANALGSTTTIDLGPGTLTSSVTLPQNIIVLPNNNTGIATIGNGSANNSIYSGTVTLGANGTGQSLNLAGAGNSTDIMNMSGKIQDPTGLTGPAGVLSISGNVELSASNTYTGGTVVNSGGALSWANTYALGTGTLTLNNGSSLGLNDGSSTAVNNAVIINGNFTVSTNGGTITLGTGPVYLTGSRTLTTAADAFTINGVIQDLGGSGFGLTIGNGKSGQNQVVTFTGLNTFDGGITLNLSQERGDGASDYFNIGNLGNVQGTASALGTGTLTINPGSGLDSSASGTITTNNAEVWNGPWWFNGSHSLNTGTGNVLMNATTAINVAGSTLTIGGVISDGGHGFGVTDGQGNLTLSASNTYTGATDAFGTGTLQLAAVNAVSNSSLVNVNYQSMLDIDGLNQSFQALSGALEGTTAGTVTSSVVGTATITITGSGGAFAGVIQNGSVTKIVAFTMAGTGVQTLSGADTYTGATNVTSGTLIVSGSLSGTASSSVTSLGTLEVDGSMNKSATIAASDGTIQGTGRIGTLTLTSTSTLAPGLTTNGPVASGVLTVLGNVTFSDTASMLSIAMGVASSGTDSTQVASTGTVTLDHTRLVLSLGAYMNNPSLLNTVYVILNGGVTNYGTGGEFIDYNGADIAANSSFTTSSGFQFTVLAGTENGDANSVALDLTGIAAIPEPGTWAALISGFGLLLVVQNARRRVRL